MPEHITAKLFDLICLNMQLALIQSTTDFVTQRDKIIELAADLEKKDTIPAVKLEIALIHDVQTEDYWQGITLPMIETLRRKLRGLIQFIDRKSIQPCSVMFDLSYGIKREKPG